MKGIGSYLIKCVLILLLMLLMSIVTMCTGIIVDDETYSKSDSENENVNSNYTETGDVIGSTFYNLYYKKYAAESFYYTLEDLKDTPDDQFSGLSYDTLINMQENPSTASALLSISGLNQASLNQVLKDADRYEDNITLDYLKLEKFDEYLNLNQSGNGYTDPANLLKPLATTCDLTDEGLNVKDCELEKIYDSENDQVLVDGQAYSSSSEGYQIKEGETESSVSDYGLGSLVNYKAFYQPSKIENYNFVSMKTINEDTSYKNLSEATAYKNLATYEIKQEQFNKYSKDSPSFVAPQGSYATGYYRPDSTIYYKNWIIGANRNGTMNAVNAYLENNYASLGFASKEDAWAKVQASVSSGIPVTTVSYLIDYAATMFGTYDFGIEEEWTYLTDSTNTETTFYFKEYPDAIYSSSINDAGRNAARYKAVYDTSNTLLGYIKDSENPEFTPAEYTSVDVIPDTYEDPYYVCVTKKWNSLMKQYVTTETVGACQDSKGTTETRYNTVRNYSDCEMGMDSCTLIESDARSHTRTPDGNFYDYRKNNGCDGNYGCWNFHIVLSPDKQWTDENIELTGDTNNYNSSAYYSDELRLAKVDRTSSMRTPTFTGFYFHPAYLFTLTSNLKGELQMRIASHVSANISTNEDDNTMYIKNYMKNYENYVPINETSYVCTTDINSTSGREVNDKSQCKEDEYIFMKDNYGHTIKNNLTYSSMTDKQRETLSGQLGIEVQDGEGIYFSNQTLMKSNQKNFDNLSTILSRYSLALKTATGLTGMDSNLLAMLIAEHEDNYVKPGRYTGYDLTKGFKETKTITVTASSSQTEKIMALGLYFQSLMEEYHNVFPLALTAYEASVTEGSGYKNSIRAGLNKYLESIKVNDIGIIFENPNDVTWYHFMPNDYSSTFFQALEGYCFKFILKGENDSFNAVLWNKNQMKDNVDSSESDVLLSQAWFTYKMSPYKEQLWKLLTYNEEPIDKANYADNGDIDYNTDSSLIYDKIERKNDTDIDIDSELTTVLSKPGQSWNSINEAVKNNDISYFALSLGGLQGGVPYNKIFGNKVLEWMYEGMAGCENDGTCKFDDNGELVLSVDNGTEILAPVDGYIEVASDNMVTITSLDGGDDYGYYSITFYGVEASDSIRNRSDYCEITEGNENDCREVSAGNILGTKVKDEVKVSLKYGKIQDGKVNFFYTENIYNKIDEYRQRISKAAQMYVNFSMYLQMIGGAGTIYGAEANEIWFAINAMKAAGIRIAGASYNCTAYVSYFLYSTYKDMPGFSDSVWGSAGEGYQKAELLANANPGLFTLQHSLAEEETDWSVFSYIANRESNPSGHTGMCRTFKNDEGLWCVEVSEGNMGYNGLYGVPGTGIRNAIYTLDEWNNKYGNIDYAVKK